MKYTMHLQPQPFSMIRSGEKTIELRLYDEKRQQIAVNDEIEFCCPECGQTPYTVRVKAMHRFRNFAELYAALPLLRCGYTGETLASASPDDMNAYYSPQEQAKYGVVGIEVKPILQDGALLRASRFLSLVLRHKPEGGWDYPGFPRLGGGGRPAGRHGAAAHADHGAIGGDCPYRRQAALCLQRQ